MSVERSKAGSKKRSPEGLSLPNQNIIIMNIILFHFYMIFKEYDEIQLRKTKMHLNNRKMKKSSSTLSRSTVPKYTIKITSQRKSVPEERFGLVYSELKNTHGFV